MTPQDYKSIGRNLPHHLCAMPKLGLKDAAVWLYEAVESHLIGVDQWLRTPDYHGYWVPMVQSLAISGWQKLGHGHFSAVFKHAHFPELAFKVGFKKEDAGAQYAAWCRANQDKGYAIPEVLLMARFKEAYIVVMPEYRPINRSDDTMRRIRKAESRLSDPDCPPSAGDTLYRTADAIGEFFRGMADFDLHAGNVMQDAQGHLIITDPVSNTRRGSDDPELWVAARMRSLSKPEAVPTRTPGGKFGMINMDFDSAWPKLVSWDVRAKRIVREDKAKPWDRGMQGKVAKFGLLNPFGAGGVRAAA